MPPDSNESKSKTDVTSLLYIVFGIPAIFGFIAILFSLTRACGIPA